MRRCRVGWQTLCLSVRHDTPVREERVLIPSQWDSSAIGKRKEYLKKLLWYNNWCGELEGTEVDGRTTEWVMMRELEHKVGAKRAERAAAEQAT